jgi:hypothetical protein
MMPKIGRQVDNRLEVRITNAGDHLLFHATDKGIEWDGIGLGQHLDRTREGHTQHEQNSECTTDADMQRKGRGRTWDR